MEEPTYSARPNIKPKTKQGSTVGGIIVLVVFALLVIGALKLLTGGAKAKYQVSDTQVTFVNDTTVSVSFKVTNTGKAKGQPICKIDAHSDDHSYYGGDMPRLDKTLNPGDSTTTAGPITINKNGASNVSTADITCS